MSADFKTAFDQMRRRLSAPAKGPNFWTVTLACLREHESLDVRDDVRELLAVTKDLPGNAAISLTDGAVSVVVDDNNCVLGFK